MIGSRSSSTAQIRSISRFRLGGGVGVLGDDRRLGLGPFAVNIAQSTSARTLACFAFATPLTPGFERAPEKAARLPTEPLPIRRDRPIGRRDRRRFPALAQGHQLLTGGGQASAPTVRKAPLRLWASHETPRPSPAARAASSRPSRSGSS